VKLPSKRALAAGGWLVALPLAGVAAARIARYDGHPFLSMANAATQFLYLPAWGAVGAGLVTGTRSLTAVAGAVVAAHVAWTAPELRRRRPQPPGLRDAPRLRVVTSNVRYASPDSTPLGMELAATGADVLLLQELDTDHLATIKAAGAFDPFPYSYVDTRSGSFGAGIWSRYPISDGETWEPGGLPMVRATITVDETPVHVFNIHCKAPMRRRWIPIWKTQLAAVMSEANVAARTGPVVVAGDFNSTWGHEPFRRLLAGAQLRDAHVDDGRGLATTWPRGGRITPPLFRLDHVLVSEGLYVLGTREGIGHTSDHRPVIADLALVPERGDGADARPARRVSAASG
jgi:endonuclease/exonuclease/phosphatase (EEP) superfamily protein YafD